MILNYKNSNIHYSVKGSGNAIVFLHGFLENSTMWKHIIPYFEKKYTVVLIDLPSHGKSETLGEINAIDEQAIIVNEILNHHNIDSCKIIGHSMGSYVGLSFLEQFPYKINGICLLNSTPFADSDERKEMRLRACKAIKDNKNIFIRIAISNLFAQNNLEKYSFEIDNIKKQAYNMQVGGIIASTHGMRERKDRSDLLNSSDCKKLLILGKKDSIISFSDLEKYAIDNNIPLVVTPNGHMSFIEDEQLVIESLLEFCN